LFFGWADVGPLPNLLNRRNFIARVNRWALQHQAPVITERMLQDWNEEGVFQAAFTFHGDGDRTPKWRFDYRHYHRALLICRLKKLGRDRFSELRAILWFRGVEIPGGPPRDDLAAEFARAVKALLRPISSTYQPILDGTDDPKAIRRLRKQLGEQHPIFKGTFLEAEDDRIIASYGEGRFGNPQVVLTQFENHVVSEIAAEWGMDQNAIVPAHWPGGIMANPAEMENGGIVLIQTATDEQLDAARNIYWLFLRSPSLINFLEGNGLSGELKLTKELMGSIPILKKSIQTIPAWSLFLLVNFLAVQKQAPEEAELIQKFQKSNIINGLKPTDVV